MARDLSGTMSLSSVFGKPLNTKRSICRPITLFPKLALHSDNTLTASIIRNDLIRALTVKPRMRPTLIRCRQSRWQHNKGSHPLIRTQQTVQTNRATSVLHPRFTLIDPLLDLRRCQIIGPCRFRHRRLALNNLQNQRALPTRRPSLYIFVLDHAHVLLSSL